MNATLLSIDLRGRRLSALVFLGAAALTACDNDRSVGPNPAAIPTAASPAMVAKGSAIMISIVDQNKTAPTTLGAQFTVAPTGGGPAAFLVDNGPGDTDPTANSLRMAGLIGTYTVCQTVAPTDYVLPTPACQSVMVNGITPAKLQFVDLTVGRLQWVTLDMIDTPVGGAAFSWNDGSGPITIVDNSALDLDKTPGRFEVKAPNGSTNVCTLTPPTGWIFAAPTQVCFGLPVPAGQTTFLTNFNVHPEYSAFWYAGNPNGWMVGPSSYTITNASGFSATVEDDVKNDRWQAQGKMWVILPTDGDYEICQTTPPPGTLIADPKCIQVTVKLGDQPAYAGGFMSMWQ